MCRAKRRPCHRLLHHLAAAWEEEEDEEDEEDEDKGPRGRQTGMVWRWSSGRHFMFWPVSHQATYPDGACCA